MALEVGSPIAHYDVTALIGEGGIGQIFEFTDGTVLCCSSVARET